MQLSTFRLLKNQEGFINLTDDQLKKYQDVLMNITSDIMDVCNSIGVNAMLAYGSALGAVRHAGFIPWDDDMDLYMFRADYEKFMPKFKEKFGHKYWIHTPDRTRNYGAMITKILLKGTVVRQLEDHENDECGAFIDIFIIENEFENELLARLHALGCFVLAGAISCRRIYRDRKFLYSVIKDEYLIGAIKSKALLGKLIGFISLDTLTKAANTWYKLCKNDDSRRVIIPCNPKRIWGDLYDRDWFVGTRKHKFGIFNWSIPMQVEKYLERSYGDYMKLPPLNEREKHTFIEFQL